MYNQKKQQGFTLIELVVVIVILGILAATAAPKFIDLTSDANESVLESVGGNILSASKLVYAKSIIQGVQNQATADVDLDNDGITDVAVIYGYPSGDRTGGIANALDLGDDWAYGDRSNHAAFVLTSSSLVTFSGITNNNIPITGTNCYLTYTPPTAAGLSPTVTYITDGC
ncbi:type II secretion system protein [Pseudocolwellia sp. AS88]|uniref:type II secretion system protein n=1 Tax=Pseudocolwellia sp. AS88 TaxID=3063958 RepID=UPI0026EC5122|nr:type II secretion system protein [Pseudocolwellia sp. AS88]MDO7083461.1 type II secretion system protein [Pseudocolwellia sp. AS88]